MSGLSPLGERERWLIRLCAPFGLVGALIAAAGTVLHPDLPSDAEAALSIVARHGHWPIIHLGIIVAAVLTVFGLRGVIGLFPDALGFALAQLSLVSAVVGAGVLTTAIGIDGYTTISLARAWLEGGGGEGPGLLIGHAVEMIHNGLAYIWMPLFLGLPPFFGGLAFAIARRAFIIGLLGVAAGGFVIVTGMSNFLATNTAFEIVSQIGAGAAVLWYFAANLVALGSLRASPPN